MTIGRAVSLCLRNVGGQRVGKNSKSVFGQPARTGLCFAEWEERSPWPSLACQLGFRADEDVVTVHAGKGTFPMADTNNDDALDLLYLVAKTTAFPLSNKYLTPSASNGQMVLAFNPLWAERFGRVFPDIVELQGYLWEHCWQPIDLWPAANRAVLEANGRVDEEGRVPAVRTTRSARRHRVRRSRRAPRRLPAQLGRQRARQPRRGPCLRARSPASGCWTSPTCSRAPRSPPSWLTSEPTS